MAKKKRADGYLTSAEIRKISKSNRKITGELEEKWKRKNVPESAYLTTMKDPRNAVEFEDLHTCFFTDAGTVRSVDGVTFEVPIGKTVGIVGESGCGKSVTSLSLMQLLQRPQGQIVSGSIRLNMGDKAYEISNMTRDTMRDIRGNAVSMIFQEPMTSLNPVFRIGDQVDEVIALHDGEGKSKKDIRRRTIELLEMVGIANSEGVSRMFPHELSGGMRQRVMIAMALACNPRVIIADEPTTALDVTIQAQILDLLRELKDRINSSIMLITHDLGVIAQMADYVVVMYAGRIVEKGTAEDIFYHPSHPYTIGLMASKPVVGKEVDELYSIPGKVPNPVDMPDYCYYRDRCDRRLGCCDGKYPCEISLSETHKVSCYRYDPAYAPQTETGTDQPAVSAMMASAGTVSVKEPEPAKEKASGNEKQAQTVQDPILEVRDLKKYFPIKGGLFNRVVGQVKAVDGVSFVLPRGTTMGLVGESGCGKTTTGRTILRLNGEKTGGDVLFNGHEVYDIPDREMRNMRTKMQIIFQDPFSSLSPRLPVGEIIGEAVREHGIVPAKEYEDYIDRVMDECGLQPFHKSRYPHEFSGGQRQRICIARALALNPEFVVCDEPVSALDVSIQAQIINLLRKLQEQRKLSYLFISHDLSVVEHISDTVGVMYLGNLVEYGAKKDIFREPLHPYTRALFSAIPIPDPHTGAKRIILEGSIPSPANPPAGCKFHTRCKECREQCRSIAPVPKDMGGGHIVSCHLYD